jgi:branched-chain amino acid transport system permease protein
MTFSVFGQILINGIVVSSVYVLLAVGFNLVWGILGILNFSHGFFYMLGAFLAWFLISSLGLSFYPAFIIASVAIFFLAALSLKFVLGPVRDNEFVCVIISLGLVSLIEGTVSAVFGGEARMVRLPLSGIINIGGLIISYSRLASLIISVVILGIFLYVVYFTKFGRAMRAAGSDPEMAQVQGINIPLIFFLTFCIGTALAGMGGIIACHMTPLEPHMGFDFSVKAFIIVVIGGLGSIPGAILGALIIGLIESFIGTLINPTIAAIVSFIVILGIILVKPSGLLGVSSR